jgi:hypothetical protein
MTFPLWHQYKDNMPFGKEWFLQRSQYPFRVTTLSLAMPPSPRPLATASKSSRTQSSA